ncbi:hypothetical protein ACS0TY_019344 [Phlomoides rotata]
MGEEYSHTLAQLLDFLLPKIASELPRLLLPILDKAAREKLFPASSQEVHADVVMPPPLANNPTVLMDCNRVSEPATSSRDIPDAFGEATSPPTATFPMAAAKLSYAKAIANHKQEIISMDSLQAMKPVRKGMYLTVTVDEKLYKEGVLDLRDTLIGRIIHVRGDKPLVHDALVTRLGDIWGIKTPWSLIPLGESYYNIRFSCDADREKIFVRRSWQLKPGLLRLQRWVPNFIPFRVNTSVVQAWIRISELPLEYWNKHIITALASAVGTVIKIDKRTLSRTMGRFARILVEFDLKHDREKTLMFERDGHYSFVSIQYEHLPDFCKSCTVIGHTTGHCGGDSRKKKPGTDAIISKSKEDRPAEAVKGPAGGTKQWVRSLRVPPIHETISRN